jgi:uncharacterized protein involved in type VI secretion and phage assembly
VTNVVDPDGQGRVKITLPWSPDTNGVRYEQWARLATLMAGNGCGTFFIPNKDDEVLVVFQGGDPSYPFVIGALWNGKDSPPDSISGPNERRMIRSPGGIMVTLDDRKGQEVFTVELPGQQRKLVLSNGGGSFLLQDDLGNSIRMDSNGVKITAGLKVEIDCSKAVINAGDLTVNAGTATFSGIVKADSVVTNSIDAATYTPGAGNIL